MKKCSVFGGKNTREKKIRTRVFLQKHVCFWGILRKPSTKAFAEGVFSLVQRALVQGSSVQGLKFKYSRLNKRTYPLNLKHRTLNSFSSLNFKLFYNFTISQPTTSN
ncbi:hypothetical protein D1003_08975 [Riemerella anatipestifer]|nr:hypothetical protein [Riemerella anatipestifer]